MIKVNTSADCGNSPKNLFLQKVTIAFATGDVQTVLNAVADDIALEIIGEGMVQGKDEFAKTLKRLTIKTATELTIDHVVSHGKAGAVNGTIERNKGTSLSFCNVYEFTGAKGDCVKKILSYRIEIE
ncbi:MAG: nuclear transport factor 2 family protein [Chloroflexota bacterium]